MDSICRWDAKTRATETERAARHGFKRLLRAYFLATGLYTRSFQGFSRGSKWLFSLVGAPRFELGTLYPITARRVR